MRKILSAAIAVLLIFTLIAPPAAAGGTDLDAVIGQIAGYVLRTVRAPNIGSAGGEWAIIGLARSNCDVPDSYYESYYRQVEKYVADAGGALSAVRYTEYSRIILSLTAAGYDPRSVAGYDLTAPLEDLDSVVKQGVNSLTYALLALDSNDYPSAMRETFIAEILRRQLSNGGWNLAGGISDSTKNQAADPDVTGMVLQALAKYQHLPEIRSATENAIERLSVMQKESGGYIGWEEENIESAAQVLVALCELGIPFDDPRFVKNGNTLVDNILTYMNPDYSFNHTPDGKAPNQMSAEQALYSFVAVQRAAGGKNSLYRMADAVQRENIPADGGDANGSDAAAKAGLPGKDPNVNAMPVVSVNKTFEDIQGHASQAAIEALAARGIISGRSDVEFAPDDTMMRAEFAAIVTRGLGLMSSAAPAGGARFADVTAGAWYFEYVNTAASFGIVKGVSETLFDPGSTITRQEAAVMVARAAALCGLDTEREPVEIRDALSQFGDYRTVADWAQSSLAFCYSTGILDDSMLDISPTTAILRCEIAEMLYRLLTQAKLL